MRVELLAIQLAAVALLTVFLAGCETNGVPAASSSREEAVVSGTVRVRGKPVNNGTLVFNPANISRADTSLRQAEIRKDGTYTVKTLVGQNLIQVSCRELLTAKNRMYAEAEIAFTAESGDNTFDIELATGPDAQQGSRSSKAMRPR